MEKKISKKIEKKLNNINELKTKLTNWKNLSEEDVFNLIKQFEKTPRDEGSYWYNEAFTDDKFAKGLLDIAQKYSSNTKMNVYITSSLGNMIQRYKLKETDEIYAYFLSNLNKKGVSVYVSLFMTNMEHFVDYPDKWGYIMSIKDMKPLKIAESSFESIIKKEKENIPKENKKAINDFFREKAEKANNEYGKKYYLELSEEFA